MTNILPADFFIENVKIILEGNVRIIQDLYNELT